MQGSVFGVEARDSALPIKMPTLDEISSKDCVNLVDQ